MHAAVKADDLVVEKSGVGILRGLSFEIKPGTITGLLGPSGAGKTTLIRTIVGLQKIASGQAEVLGLEAGAAELRGKIGYMAQSSAIYDDLSVRQNLCYFADMIGAPRPSADELVERVELNEQRDRLVGTLSGGQRTRVSLAVALLGEPSLLILDEPTVGLDPRLRADLWQSFAGLAKAGTTIVVSSHVMDEAKHCDSLLLIRDGELLAQDTPDGICKRAGVADVEAAFLKLTEASSEAER